MNISNHNYNFENRHCCLISRFCSSMYIVLTLWFNITACATLYYGHNKNTNHAYWHECIEDGYKQWLRVTAGAWPPTVNEGYVLCSELCRQTKLLTECKEWERFFWLHGCELIVVKCMHTTYFCFLQLKHWQCTTCLLAKSEHSLACCA